MALRPLATSEEFTFPAGTFDVRGWEVRTGADEARVGRVADMLLDEHGTPRYLDIEVAAFGKHVLLPIGQARVDESEDVVWIPGLEREAFKGVPAYRQDAGEVTPDHEQRLADTYAGAYRDDRYAAPPKYRSGDPVIRGRRTMTAGRLARLEDLEDFRIAVGDPDPRGWDVLAADGDRIGTVTHLIADTEVLKIRYLDCDLDEEELGLAEEDRHVLIPIGYARLDEEGERVIVDAIGSADVRALPTYRGLPVEREYEEELHTRFTADVGGQERYRHPRYSHRRFYAPRKRR